MAKYKIVVKKSAEKEIKNLPAADLKKVLSKIKSLGDEPFPFGSIKLSNDEKYRVRCGNYRILYTVEQDVLTIIIVKVGHRKDVYR